MSANDKVLGRVLSRLGRLERAVFQSGRTSAHKTKTDAKKQYTGATGGIRLLADEG